MALPLEGIRVLDMTRVLAGPFSTMMLADMGAEVIKVEVPGTGDDSRAFGPFKNGQSLYFVSINRGKESIAIDLKKAEGIKVFLELVKKCDVLVENFRPGTMEKLGIGWEKLRVENPRLIYAAISGFGHSGPYSNRPAYDILVQAMGGIMSITGWPDSPPTRVGCSMGDITAAVFGTTGILAALYQRTVTGAGQKVDVAMLDCQLAILENALTRYQVEQKSPLPLGTRHPTITPFQAFEAQNGWFVIAVGNDSLWKTFCTVLKRDDLLADERFSSNALRTKHITELVPELEVLFRTKPMEHWLGLLENAGVPCAPVNTIDRVMDDPQLKARSMFVTVEDKRAGTVIIPGNPVKMDMITEKLTRPSAPDIGEHTNAVLHRICGYDEERIESLRREGAIA